MDMYNTIHVLLGETIFVMVLGYILRKLKTEIIDVEIRVTRNSKSKTISML